MGLFASLEGCSGRGLDVTYVLANFKVNEGRDVPCEREVANEAVRALG